MGRQNDREAAGAVQLSIGTAARDLLALPLGADELEQRQLVALSARVKEAIGPCNFLEEFWVHEVTIGIWEVQRLQACKASLLRNTREEDLAHLLVGRVEGAHLLSIQARQGVEQACEAIAAGMERFGVNECDVVAQSLLLNLETYERLDELINRASGKVTRLLKDIDARRMRLADSLRTVAEVEMQSQGKAA